MSGSNVREESGLTGLRRANSDEMELPRFTTTPATEAGTGRSAVEREVPGAAAARRLPVAWGHHDRRTEARRWHAKFSGFRLPDPIVSVSFANQCVRQFVQDHFENLRRGICQHERTGQHDGSASIAADAKSSACFATELDSPSSIEVRETVQDGVPPGNGLRRLSWGELVGSDQTLRGFTP